MSRTLTITGLPANADSKLAGTYTEDASDPNLPSPLLSFTNANKAWVSIKRSDQTYWIGDTGGTRYTNSFGGCLVTEDASGMDIRCKDGRPSFVIRAATPSTATTPNGPAIMPLSVFASYFAPTMEETVNASATIQNATSSRFWYSGKGGVYVVTGSTVAGTSLSFSENGTTVSATLLEIVYLLNLSSTGVGLVVLVFHAGQRRIGVTVSAQTFADLLAYAARAYGVLVSTVAADHTKVPTVSGNFPNVNVAFSGTSEPSPISALKPTTARIAVVSASPAGSTDATPMLMGTAIRPGATYFGVLAPVAAAQAHVEMLDDTNRQLLHSSVLETVTARAAIATGNKGATWTGRGGEHGIDAGWLAMPVRAKAPLSEVIYVVGSASVSSVLLVFKSGHELVVVPISSGAFKQHFASLAWGVSVSTVAAGPQVHSSVPVLTDSGSYPKLALNFTSEQSGVPAESALAFSVPRIVGGVLRYMSAPARMFGKVVAASAASTQSATPETVEPLDTAESALLVMSVLKPVTTSAVLTTSASSVEWNGGAYKIDGAGLTAPQKKPAPLSEVIYAVGASGVACILVFKGDAFYAVKVKPSTARRLEHYAKKEGVIVSTVATTAAVHDAVPVIPLTEQLLFGLSVTFKSAIPGLPTGSVLVESAPRIVVALPLPVLRYASFPKKIFGVQVAQASAASTQSAATSASTAPDLAQYLSAANALLISTKQQMMSTIQNFPTSNVGQFDVVPLSFSERALLLGTVKETVWSQSQGSWGQQGATWPGQRGEFGINVNVGELTLPGKAQVKAPLSEVIYVVGDLPTPYAGSAFVSVVLLVFKNGAEHLVVPIKRDAFKRHFSALAGTYASAGAVSTVAEVAQVHESKPSLTDAGSYPGLALTFASASGDVPPASALSPSVPRIRGGVLRYTSLPENKKVFGVPVTSAQASAGQSGVAAGEECGMFVPFGALSDASCAGASLASGAECDVKCYAGFKGEGKAKCTDGAIVFSGCVPVPSHRTIEIVGAGEYDGKYEAVAPYAPPLQWKSAGDRVIIASATEDKLALYSGPDFVSNITVSGGGSKTTLKFVELTDATATFGSAACEGYWETWDTCGEACGAIAECAASAETSQATARLIYEGAAVTLRALYISTGSAGPAGPAGPLAPTGQTAPTGPAAPIAMYGTLEGVHYVLKGSGDTAKVIRKSGQTVDVLDVSRKDGEWKVSSAAVVPVIPVAAECADLRACLKSTPLEACATKTCKPTKLASSGEKLEHGGKSVELYALDDARVGSDERGMFVVTKDGKKGKMLFVEAGATTGATVDVALDEGTWRASPAAPAGPNWTLIIGIGGGVVGLLILIAVLVFAFTRKSGPTAPVGAYGPAAPGAAIGAIGPAAGPP